MNFLLCNFNPFAGMTSAALSFLLSGLLEVYVTRYPHDDCHGDVSIAWQLPQLFFISIAEAIVDWSLLIHKLH